MLQAATTLFVTLHVIGAALGAAGVLYAEILYAKATADGRVDAREREYFATTYWALQWGMITVLLSGIALIFTEYLIPDISPDVLYAPLWMQNVLVLVITFSGWLLSRRELSWSTGSALAFSGWWMMLILDAFRTTAVSFVLLVIIYIVFAFVSVAFWGYVRAFMHARYYDERRKQS